MNERTVVIECPECGRKSEYTVMNVLDSRVNAFEKQKLLNGNLFEHKCAQCGHIMDLIYDMCYRDVEHSALVYMVESELVKGAYAALQLTDALENKNGCVCMHRPKKRIVSCHHQLCEKALIFDNGLDDRIIELIKIICLSDVEENIPDLHPFMATFNMKNGEQIIELIGEKKTVSAAIPNGLYERLQLDFAEALEEDDEYIINDLWALNTMGIDPGVGCDGDCENCVHCDCDDEFDYKTDDECSGYFAECDDDCDNCGCPCSRFCTPENDYCKECLECERDCEDCDCLRCEDFFDDYDEDEYDFYDEDEEDDECDRHEGGNEK